MNINNFSAKTFLGKLSYAYIISELYKNKIIKSSSFTSVYNGQHLEKKIAFYIKTKLKHILSARDSFLSNHVEKLSISYSTVYLDFNINKYTNVLMSNNVYSFFFAGELEYLLRAAGCFDSRFMNINPKSLNRLGLSASMSFVHEINEFLQYRDNIVYNKDGDVSPELKQRILSEGYIFEKISKEIEYIANIDIFFNMIFDYFESYIDKFTINEIGDVVPKDDFSITFSNLMHYFEARSSCISKLCRTREEALSAFSEENRALGLSLKDMENSLTLLKTHCEENPEKLERFLSDKVPDYNFDNVTYLSNLFSSWGTFKKDHQTETIVEDLSGKVARYCASIRGINL